MHPDVIFILILGYIMLHCTTGNGFGDYIACVGASIIIFAVVKAPFLGFMGGWTFPMSTDPHHQLVSGSISFIIVGLLYACAIYRKRRRA